MKKSMTKTIITLSETPNETPIGKATGKIMKSTLITTLMTSCLLSGAAFASDDCTDPLTDWQPKEELRQMMADKGWNIKRIKVDDGCYEVKGRDRNGHRVEAKFSPASLKLIELEIKFDGSGDTAGYLDLGKVNSAEKSDAKFNSKFNSKDATSKKQSQKNKPKATIE